MKSIPFKVNKKLLPVKGHYFFVSAGNGFISPFIPVIAKGLGFSAIQVGWIYTITPIMSLFLKPFVGGIADKFKAEKSIFLILLLANAMCLFSLQWVPSFSSDNTIELDCNTLSTKICPEEIIDSSQHRSLSNSIKTAECEVKAQSGYHDINSVYLTKLLMAREIHITNDSSMKFKLHEDSMLEDNCMFIKFKTNESQVQICGQGCNNTTSCICEMSCSHSSLNELIRKQVNNEKNIFSSYHYWLLLFLVVISRSATSCSNSLIDSITFNILGDKPQNYGLQKMWAGIGWGLTAVTSGLLVDEMSEGKEKNYILSFYVMLGFYIVDLLIVFMIKMQITKKSQDISKDVAKLIKNPKIIIFMVWCFINGVFQAFISNFLIWFIEDIAVGKDDSQLKLKTLEGLALLWQCYGGEIPLMFFSRWILKKLSHVTAMTIVLLGFGARFVLYSCITEPWWILPIESLHGITYGLFYAIMTTYSNFISPPGTQSTVQSLMSSIYEGAGLAVGSIIGGYLYNTEGPSKTFLIMGSSALAFGMLHFFIQAIIKKQPINQEENKIKDEAA